MEQAGKNYTEIEFAVNDDMACTLFTGCKQVALIAQASLQSSLSFLNFLVSTKNMPYMCLEREWIELIPEQFYF